jgi:hypothetical protein
METVLYESPDISRNDLTDIYGPPTYVRQFIDILKERYSDKKLTIYGKKRIVMTTKKNIAVYGGDPIFHNLTEEEQKTVNYTVPFAAILVQKWGYGFYHFVNEMLPKILRIYEYNSKIPIVTFYNDTFIKSILNYIGVTNPIIPYDGRTAIIVKCAITVTDTASGNPSPNDIDIIRKYISCNETNKDVIILIYRKEQLRTISNFDEMYNGLKNRFTNEKFVVFGSLPFDNTVKLFQQAKLIIGAHGAGLSNMIFGTKGTPIIEIFPADLVNACYWHLSWILENPHHILVAKSSGRPLLNMTVDLDKLYSLITRIGA